MANSSVNPPRITSLLHARTTSTSETSTLIWSVEYRPPGAACGGLSGSYEAPCHAPVYGGAPVYVGFARSAMFSAVWSGTGSREGATMLCGNASLVGLLSPFTSQEYALTRYPPPSPFPSLASRKGATLTAITHKGW